MLGVLLGHLGAGFAEDVADALDGLGAFRQGLALRARQGGEQVGGDRFDRDLLLDVRLDRRQVLRVKLASEGDGIALGAKARGAADAVHVVLGLEGQVEVVDVADAVDVQAARGHVGGDEDLELAALELRQQALALLLRHVAAEHADEVAAALQRAADALDHRLGVHEHHRAVARAAREQAQQQRDLLVVGREVDLLPHAGGGDRLGLDDQLLRLVHVLVRELEHAVAERGREQQGLALLAGRQAAHQEAQVLDEAEVEHAVGLVEDADLAGVQADDMLLHVVDQAAGRGDDHVGAGLQQLALLVVVDAAVDQRVAQAELAAELQRVLVDLDGQLAGRGEDQGARVAVLAVGQRRAGQQAVHHAHQEGERLAGAGLGLAGDVAAGEADREGHGLDGGAAGEPGFLEAGHQGRVKVETGQGDVGQRFVAHGILGCARQLEAAARRACG